MCKEFTQSLTPSHLQGLDLSPGLSAQEASSLSIRPSQGTEETRGPMSCPAQSPPSSSPPPAGFSLSHLG